MDGILCEHPGAVYPADFGLPYLLVETRDGVKRFYGEKENIAPLLP